MGLRLLTLCIGTLLYLLFAVCVSTAQEVISTDTASNVATPEILLQKPSSATVETSSATLAEVLAHQKYQDQSYIEPAGETWLEKFWNWLMNLFSKAGIPVNSDLSLIAVILIVVILIAVIVRMIWGTLGRRRFMSSPALNTAAREDLSASGLRTSAAEAAASGNLRAAIRYRFLAVLSEAQLPYSALMTNTQVKRRFKREFPAVLNPFSDLVLAYENAWYGGHEISVDSYSSADKLAQTVEQSLGEES